MLFGECGRDDALHLLFVMDSIENFFLWLGDISENFTDTIIVFRDEIIDELMNQFCVASLPHSSWGSKDHVHLADQSLAQHFRFDHSVAK